MQQRRRSLRRWLRDAPEGSVRLLRDRDTAVTTDAVRAGSILAGQDAGFAGRSVLLRTRAQITTALALLDLDGLARRVVIAPPDLRQEDQGAVVEGAGVDVVLTDEPDLVPDRTNVTVARPCALVPRVGPDPQRALDTEWVLLTSGTTGAPKLVVHSLEALTGGIGPAVGAPPVWGTFYDIRRYGGLQILLRTILGGGSLVLSQAGEPVGDHLRRLAAAGVTHVSGTPSHWRRAVMSLEAGVIAPRTVRLSGEIADQAILDTLSRIYPQAAVGHAYASTEAGVGFEVDDGREGFPARFLDPGRPVEMKIVDGSLRIRSSRTASRYIGEAAPVLADPEGFVDTDDMVERQGDRCHFVGRRSGVINVGGLKVHPEEVEAVINRHPGVRMSLVKGRTNPITGSIVVADVVPEPALDAGEPGDRQAALKAEILARCRDALPQHKVPVLLRFAPSLAVTAAGKLLRSHA